MNKERQVERDRFIKSLWFIGLGSGSLYLIYRGIKGLIKQIKGLEREKPLKEFNTKTEKPLKEFNTETEIPDWAKENERMLAEIRGLKK